MSYLISFFVLFRLFIWRIFPQFSTGVFSDSVFSLIVLTLTVIYFLNRRYSPFSPWLMLWILIALTSVFHSSNFAISFTSLNIFLINILCFSITILFIRDFKAVRLIWITMLLSAILSAGQGIWEFYLLRFLPPPTVMNPITTGIYIVKRSCSFLGWPTAFTGYLILFIPGVWKEFKNSLGKAKIFWIASLIILLLGLISAFSVLAPFSLIIAIIVSGNIKRLKWMLSITGVGVFLAGGTKTLSTFINARSEYYQEAWHMILHHPFIGQGLGTFQSSGSSPSTFTHNSYLQIWAEIGPLGLICVLGIVYTLWNMRPRNNYERGMYIGLLAFFIDNLFSFTLLKPNLAFVGWVILACYSILYRLKLERV